MTDQEKDTLYSILLRLIDDGNVLTDLERRDLLNQLTSARCGITSDEILAATENDRRLRIKRGTTAQNNEYIGLSGELLMDTDTNTLRVHDGITPGGHVVAGGGASLPENIDYVVEWQTPTAENNYTWYRKYASGWVEQGGVWTGSKSCGVGQEAGATVNLPVEMQDTNYCAGAMVSNIYLMHMGQVTNTTSIQFRFGAYSVARTLTRFVWHACGVGA